MSRTYIKSVDEDYILISPEMTQGLESIMSESQDVCNEAADLNSLADTLANSDSFDEGELDNLEDRITNIKNMSASMLDMIRTMRA